MLTERRAQVLEALDESGKTVDQLASELGVHVNTIRGHLDALLTAGLVTKDPISTNAPGRPRHRYRRPAASQSPLRALAGALTSQLTAAQANELAERAAEKWASTVTGEEKASSVDEAVHNATVALNRLGFHAVQSPLGDSITVGKCPYAALVADNPMICDIHASLVNQVLIRSNQPVSLDSMEVWARPDVCVARLRRDDITPNRTIQFGERTGT